MRTGPTSPTVPTVSRRSLTWSSAASTSATATAAGDHPHPLRNYYFLLLVFAAFVILIFTRLNNSRIGRGWVAIREDERAAEAMGVNVFGLKLLRVRQRSLPRRPRRARSRRTTTSPSPPTSSSSSSRPSSSPPSCSAAWAPSRVSSSAPPSSSCFPEKLRLLSRLPAPHVRGSPRPHDALAAGGHRARHSGGSWSSTRMTTELAASSAEHTSSRKRPEMSHRHG